MTTQARVTVARIPRRHSTLSRAIGIHNSASTLFPTPQRPKATLSLSPRVRDSFAPPSSLSVRKNLIRGECWPRISKIKRAREIGPGKFTAAHFYQLTSIIFEVGRGGGAEVREPGKSATRDDRSSVPYNCTTSSSSSSSLFAPWDNFLWEPFIFLHCKSFGFCVV